MVDRVDQGPGPLFSGEDFSNSPVLRSKGILMTKSKIFLLVPLLGLLAGAATQGCNSGSDAVVGGSGGSGLGGSAVSAGSGGTGVGGGGGSGPTGTPKVTILGSGS
jgi:hypothetical protein